MGDFFQYYGSNLAFRQLLGPYSELGVQIRNVGHYQYPARAPSNPSPHYRIKLDMDQFLLDLNDPQLDVPDDDTLFDEWLVGVPERLAFKDASESLSQGSSTTPAPYNTDERLSTFEDSPSMASHPSPNSGEPGAPPSELTNGAYDELAPVNISAPKHISSERPTTSPLDSVDRKQRELQVTITAAVPAAIEQNHSSDGSGKVTSDAATPASQASGQSDVSPLCIVPQTQDVGTPACADEELHHLGTAAHTLETETGAIDLSCIETSNPSDTGNTASPPVGDSPIPGDMKFGIQRPATLSRQASTTPTLLFGEVATPSDTATPAEAGTPPESFPSLTAHNRPKKQNSEQAKRKVQRPPTISRLRTGTRTLPFVEGVTSSNPATPVLPAATPLDFSLPLAGELPTARERQQYHIVHYRGPDMEMDCWMEPGPGSCAFIAGRPATNRSYDGTPTGNLFPVHPHGTPPQHRGRVSLSSSWPYPTNALQARQHRSSPVSLPSTPLMARTVRTPQSARAQYPVQHPNTAYMPIRRPASAQQHPTRISMPRNANPYHQPPPSRQRTAHSNSYQPPAQSTAQLNVSCNGTTVYSARRNLPPGPLVFSLSGAPPPGSARYHPYPRGARGVPPHLGESYAPNRGGTTPKGQVEELFEATNLIQATQGPLGAQTPISPLASSLRIPISSGNGLPPTRPRSASSVQSTVTIAAGTHRASEPRGSKRTREDEEHIEGGRHEKVAVTGQRRPVPKPKPRRQREGMAETL